jgi:chromosome segregation ATPase
MSEALQNEIDRLRQELASKDAGIEGLLSQVDAHREQLNESINAMMPLRTNVIHLKKLYNKLHGEHEALKATAEVAQKRVAELEEALKTVKAELSESIPAESVSE